MKKAIFNGKYQIVRMLGDGKNSNVYLCYDLKNPNKKFALKLFRQKYLKKAHAIGQITQEASVLKNQDHRNINRFIWFGKDGKIHLLPKGELKKNIVYIILEYVPGIQLCEACDLVESFGERIGRYFMRQLIDALTHMHNDKHAAHRDIKADNIILDVEL
jgi:serine/threonine protein kinase